MTALPATAGAAPAGIQAAWSRLDVRDVEGRRFRCWLLRERLPWPQVHDGRGFDGPLAPAFGIEAVPASLVVDREGRVVGRDLQGEALEALVDRLTVCGIARGASRVRQERPGGVECE